MDIWTIGLFLLGSGVGALTTAAFYVNRIRAVRRMIEAHGSDLSKEWNSRPKGEQRKSA